MDEALEGSEVWRGGVTIDKIANEHGTVWVRNGGPTISRRKESGISLSTSIASKGGGFTRVILYVPASAFTELARAIAEASPRAAISSFTAALNEIALKLPAED